MALWQVAAALVRASRSAINGGGGDGAEPKLEEKVGGREAYR